MKLYHLVSHNPPAAEIYVSLEDALDDIDKLNFRSYTLVELDTVTKERVFIQSESQAVDQ
jgi:hypothetical protein